MSRGGKRKTHRESTRLSGVKTRTQKKKLASKNKETLQKTKKDKNSEITNTSEDEISTIEVMAAPTPEQLVNFIYPFDNKKETNINYFLLQFDNLIDQTNYGNDHKLTILKAKITGPARDRLMQDESIFLEKDIQKFKEKLRELFSIKCNFSNAQNLFFNLKQKPDQNLSNFIAEFNATANMYIKKSGQNSAEEGNSKFLDKMKLARFLDAIRADIGLEVRKSTPDNFAEACKVALKLEEAYSQANMQEVNNIAPSKETEILNKLDKLSTESADQIRTLVTEINNLKLKVKERADKVAKYCEHCKRETHDTQECWFKDRHKNENSFQNGNTFQSNRGFSNTQTRPYRQNFRQQHGFQPRGYQGNSGYNNSDFYSYNYPYAAPHFYAPPPPMYNYYQGGNQGYPQYSRGRGRGTYHNSINRNKKEDYEENYNTNVSNRDAKPRGHSKRGSYDNRRGRGKRNEPEN